MSLGKRYNPAFKIFIAKLVEKKVLKEKRYNLAVSMKKVITVVNNTKITGDADKLYNISYGKLYLCCNSKR